MVVVVAMSKKNLMILHRMDEEALQPTSDCGPTTSAWQRVYDVMYVTCKHRMDPAPLRAYCVVRTTATSPIHQANDIKSVHQTRFTLCWGFQAC